ncbi:hypothetical protein FFLO_07078 [Filobasidium floriforme]|uniref:Uncharacterized protein n=1 Tax=Filobasidium floriforme TaxID=5210 RepID=A0A8K0JG35_9TREE|nr:hypothetical protein FFLO_07078 [Filobasidium floriforme]
MEFPGLDLSSHEGVTLNDMWTSHEELHDDNLPALDEDAEETFDVRKAGLNKLSKIRYMQMLEMMSEGLRELATRVAAEMEFTPEQCMFSILSLHQKKQKRSRTQSEWNAWVSLTWQEEYPKLSSLGSTAPSPDAAALPPLAPPPASAKDRIAHVNRKAKINREQGRWTPQEIKSAMEQLKATAAAKPSQPTHNKALNDEQQIILQRNKAQQIWDATCSTLRHLHDIYNIGTCLLMVPLVANHSFRPQMMIQNIWLERTIQKLWRIGITPEAVQHHLNKLMVTLVEQRIHHTSDTSQALTAGQIHQRDALHQEHFQSMKIASRRETIATHIKACILATCGVDLPTVPWSRLHLIAWQNDVRWKGVPLDTNWVKVSKMTQPDFDRVASAYAQQTFRLEKLSETPALFAEYKRVLELLAYENFPKKFAGLPGFDGSQDDAALLAERVELLDKLRDDAGE